MKASWQWTLAALLLVSGVALGLFIGKPEAQQKNILVSKKVVAAPPLEPVMGNAWKDAAPLAFKAIGGKNLQGGSTDVTMRSVHTDDMVYFLIEYKDSTLSAKREPWQKQAGGSWTKLKDPQRQGRGQQPLLRGQGFDLLEHQLAVLRAEGVYGDLPHRRGQTVRQHVHPQHRGAPGQLALEERADRVGWAGR